MRFEAPTNERLTTIRADVERVVADAKAGLGAAAPR
jgi:hypothetical protein